MHVRREVFVMHQCLKKSTSGDYFTPDFLHHLLCSKLRVSHAFSILVASMEKLFVICAQKVKNKQSYSLLEAKKLKVHFLGLLRNVDSTILDVKLEHEFRFGQISEIEGNKFFSALENLPEYITAKKLSLDYHCLNFELHKYFFVENSFECAGRDFPHHKVAEFDNKLVHSYLNPTFRLMKLFKEGNINMPLKYYFTKDPLSSFMRVERSRYEYSEPFSLDKQELKDLYNFLKKYTLPFSLTHIQLAFENFELSYEIPNQTVAFLVLMNGLEALLNPGGGEITHRISRNCAVLLGSDVEASRKIYEDVEYLYGLRCAIVHVAKKVRIKTDELKKLRDCVREALRAMLDINKDKNRALEILNEMGFGEFKT